MIGGIDIPIPTTAGRTSLEAAVRAIRQKWPTSVYENGLTGDPYSRFWDIPFGGAEEIFVYKDSDAARLWDAEGAVDEALNTMIHLIIEHDWLTVVIDEKTAEMVQILALIRSALADEILNVKEAA